MKVSKNDILDMRWESFARVFQRADRVLSGDSNLKVKVVKAGAQEFAGWSDGTTITFNRDVSGNPADLETLIELTGLNYHELCHILFTPMKGTWIVNEVTKENLFPFYNMLEDQRIESMFVAMYPSAAPYFTKMILKYLAQNEMQWKDNFALVHGRRYLPLDIRKEFYRRYRKPEIAKKIAKVIDEYRRIRFPHDEQRALELVREFAKLLQEAGTPGDLKDGIKHYDGQKHPEAEKVSVVIGKFNKDSKPDNNEAGQKAIEESEGEGEEDGDGQGKGKGQGQEAGGTGNDPYGEDADSEGGVGGGAGSSSAHSIPEAFAKRIAEAVTEVLANPDVQKELRDKQQTIKAGETVDPLKDKWSSSPAQVDAQTTMVMKKVVKEFTQLRAELDPGWNRGVSSGKLNVQRAMTARSYEDYETAFDHWEQGFEDAAGIEASILVDVSGSMSGHMDSVSKSLWIIKRAIESVDGHATVFAFNTNCYSMYRRNEPVDRSIYRRFSAQGGTNPRDALVQSKRIFVTSDAPNKMVIILSDGEWYGNDGDGLVREFNNAGIQTALVQLGYVSPQTHGCQIVMPINDPMKMVDLARQMVRRSLKSKTKR